jgi:hypothetical protein
MANSKVIAVIASKNLFMVGCSEANSQSDNRWHCQRLTVPGQIDNLNKNDNAYR